MDEQRKEELRQVAYHSFIQSLGLSKRATHVILDNCSSLDEFVDLDQEQLAAFRNCGVKTAREITKLLVNSYGDEPTKKHSATAEQLRLPPTSSSFDLLPIFSSKKLKNFSPEDLHSDFRVATLLTDLPLPVRPANVLKNMGMQTLGEVMFSTGKELLRQKNFGRKSLTELQELIRSFCLSNVPDSSPENQQKAEKLRTPVDCSSYEAMLMDFLAQCGCNARDRKIFLERLCCTEDKLPTLEELGEQFAISRERVRQILKKNIEQIKIKTNLDKLDFFWNQVDAVIAQGGGIIHLEALPQALQNALQWPTAPSFSGLGQVLLFRHPEASFQNAQDIVSAESPCRTCHHPAEQFAALDFTENESLHLQVVAAKLLAQCQQQCPYKTPVTGFHRAYLEELISRSATSCVLHEDLILSREHWVERYSSGLEDILIQILEQKGEPLHFTEIAEAVRTRNLQHKDASDHSIHSALLRYDSIELTQRGTYGLKKWDMGGYRSVSTAIEEMIEEKGLPQKRTDILEYLDGEFSEGNITAALYKETRFVKVGAGFYDTVEQWPKRSCDDLIDLLPDEETAAFARYLISQNNSSYKLVMAFIFVRSMDDEGGIYLYKLKEMFYNFYLSRYKNGLVVEEENTVMSRIDQLPASEVQNKASVKPLDSFLHSAFFEKTSDNGRKLSCSVPLAVQLKNQAVRNVLLILLLKAIDLYYQGIQKNIPLEAEKKTENTSAEEISTETEEMASSIAIKKKTRGKIRL